MKRTAEQREQERVRLVAEYNRASDAAVRGPGFTPHTSKRLASLRRRVERLGGFR